MQIAEFRPFQMTPNSAMTKAVEALRAVPGVRAVTIDWIGQVVTVQHEAADVSEMKRAFGVQGSTIFRFNSIQL